jgi:hypothetical protein
VNPNEVILNQIVAFWAAWAQENYELYVSLKPYNELDFKESYLNINCKKYIRNFQDFSLSDPCNIWVDEFSVIFSDLSPTDLKMSGIKFYSFDKFFEIFNYSKI